MKIYFQIYDIHILKYGKVYSHGIFIGMDMLCLLYGKPCSVAQTCKFLTFYQSQNGKCCKKMLEMFVYIISEINKNSLNRHIKNVKIPLKAALNSCNASVYSKLKGETNFIHISWTKYLNMNLYVKNLRYLWISKILLKIYIYIYIYITITNSSELVRLCLSRFFEIENKIKLVMF